MGSAGCCRRVAVAARRAADGVPRSHCTDAWLWWGTVGGAARSASCWRSGSCRAGRCSRAGLLYLSYVQHRAGLPVVPVGQPAARVGVLRALRDAGRLAAARRAAAASARRVPDAVAALPPLRRVGAREAAARRSDVARPDRDGDVLRDRAAADVGRLVRAPAADVGAPARRARSPSSVELGVPFLIWGPRRLRPVAFARHGRRSRSSCSRPRTTASSTTSRWRSASGCWTTAHLAGGSRRTPAPAPALAAGGRARDRPRSRRCSSRSRSCRSCPSSRGLRPLARALLPVERCLDELRSINAYHLFAQMTLVRREPVIEGSDDGADWRAVRAALQAGRRRPRAAVRGAAPAARRLPDVVPAARPRPGAAGSRPCSIACGTIPPRSRRSSRAIRSRTRRPRSCGIAVYRYRFTDAATRARTGAWWTRELEGVTRPIGE